MTQIINDDVWPPCTGDWCDLEVGNEGATDPLNLHTIQNGFSWSTVEAARGPDDLIPLDHKTPGNFEYGPFRPSTSRMFDISMGEPENPHIKPLHLCAQGDALVDPMHPHFVVKLNDIEGIVKVKCAPALD